MNTYQIGVSWILAKTLTIEAENLADALRKAEDYPLPKDGEYINASYEVDYHLVADEYAEEYQDLPDDYIKPRG